MLRRDFLKRMAFAALATWAFRELPMLGRCSEPTEQYYHLWVQGRVNGGAWKNLREMNPATDAWVCLPPVPDAKVGDVFEYRLANAQR